MRYRFNNFFSFFKKSGRTSLWKKIQKKKRQKINTQENINISSTQIAESYKALVPYPLEATSCPTENLLKIIYINFIYLNIIYLHHQTEKIDFCLQAIQKNPILVSAFQLSYNEFRAKFYNLLVISADQGENFMLALSKEAAFFSTLTYFFELLPAPFSALGGIIRLGIHETNKRHKAYESKKLLNYCITDENFTKLVSLLFSCILVKNLSETEDLDLSVKKNFSIFWEILKEQAKQFGNKPNFPKSIEKIWAYCFYLFELSAFSDSKLIPETILDPKQKISFKKINQLCGTTFFDPKKFLSLPSEQLPAINTISKFWEDKIQPDIKNVLSKPEMSPALPA